MLKLNSWWFICKPELDSQRREVGFGGDIKINWKIVFQRSVPQVLIHQTQSKYMTVPATQQRIKSLSLYHCVGLLIYTYDVQPMADIFVDCLSQEGVGGTEERQLLFPLRCPSTRSSYVTYLAPIPSLLSLWYLIPLKKTETSPFTALIFAADVEETSAQHIWDFRSYRNTCFFQ